MSQGYIRPSDSSCRAGAFYQMQTTAGDTACSVNGVLLRTIHNTKIMLTEFIHFAFPLAAVETSETCFAL